MDRINEKDLKLLITKIKKGDDDAFKKIYTYYHDYIFFICKKICCNQNDAEEVFQDTFVSVFKNINTLKDEKAFSSWIKTIAVHGCYKKNEQYKKTKEVLGEEKNLVEKNIDFLPEEFMVNDDLRQTLLKLIDELSVKQRQIVYSYYYADISTKEIAELNNCTINAVHISLRKARLVLKHKIEEMSKNKNIIISSTSIPLSLLFKSEINAYIMPQGISDVCLQNILGMANISSAYVAGGLMGSAATSMNITSIIITGLVGTSILSTAGLTYYNNWTTDSSPTDKLIYSSAVSTQGINKFKYISNIDNILPIVEEVPSTPSVEPIASDTISSIAEIDDIQESQDIQEVVIQTTIIHEDDLSSEIIIQVEPTIEPLPTNIVEEVTPEPILEPDTVEYSFDEILEKLSTYKSLSDIENIINQYNFILEIEMSNGNEENYKMYTLRQSDKKILIGTYLNSTTDIWKVKYTLENNTTPEILPIDFKDWLKK